MGVTPFIAETPRPGRRGPSPVLILRPALLPACPASLPSACLRLGAQSLGLPLVRVLGPPAPDGFGCMSPAARTVGVLAVANLREGPRAHKGCPPHPSSLRPTGRQAARGAHRPHIPCPARVPSLYAMSQPQEGLDGLTSLPSCTSPFPAAGGALRPHMPCPAAPIHFWPQEGLEDHTNPAQ